MVKRFGLTLPLIGVATAVSALLTPGFGGRAPLSPFAVAVVISAWYGGLWPGLLCTALSVAIVQFVLGASMLGLAPVQTGMALIVSFAVLGTCISVVLEHSRRAQADALAAKNRLEELNQELLARTEALVRSNEELQQFAYAVSHDLQTPLRNVGAYAQLLVRRNQDRFDEDSKEFAGYVIAGVDGMNKMIRGMLEYSRATHDESPAAPVDMNHVAQSALLDLHQEIATSGASVTVEPLPKVPSHEGLMRQVFQNLIGNALKYRGAEPPRIRVSAQKDRDHWLFTVQDNGIGMEMRHADQAFKLFRRLHTEVEYQGSGVGLAICKRIVERQGGRIWVESEVGKGSTFAFTLPDKSGLSPS
jgi:light-regulated signal transduction histidine kinase (bacteriophytochrome)